MRGQTRGVDFLRKRYAQRANAFAAAVKKAYTKGTDTCLPITPAGTYLFCFFIPAVQKSQSEMKSL